MILPVLQPQRLYRQIADLLAGHIQKGDFPPGTYLPSERDLAKQLGVSRSSVREALIALEVTGVVDIRVGNGVYVVDQPKADDATNNAPGVSPFELLEARSLFESEVTALAAQEARPEQIALIEDTITAMAASKGNHTDFLEQDHLFHLRIAEATSNQVLIDLVEYLWAERCSPLFCKFEEHYSDLSLKDSTVDDHIAILEAIKVGDSRRARVAMKDHITHVRERFIE